jgi:hypothetical protein
MPELKLAKPLDRVSVKLTITVQPELAQALREYAAVYRATYGEAESVEELVPFMLASFLEGDRGFAKARKEYQSFRLSNLGRDAAVGRILLNSLVVDPRRCKRWQ